ncbi:MAG TPA: ATP-binding protein [Terriglobales bacterium]
MPTQASKSGSRSVFDRSPELASESSVAPLITGVLAAAVIAITATYTHPSWLPPRIGIETAVLIAVLGVLGVVLVALLLRIHDISLIQKELVKTRELAALREHERDLAQQELLRKLQQERELEREKVQFQAQLSDYEKYASLAQLSLGAAHEINNPLLGIMSHLEMELRSTDDQDQRDEVEGCIEGAKRISSAVRGLLNYARPGPLLINKVNLDRLVGETVNFLEHQPMFRKIHLQKCIPGDLPQISADANQLSQVLMNLLLNAAQAMPDGGTITIASEKVKFDESIEIVVCDTGQGIPADILPHVFEPFFTTKRGKGTGLGLSISQAYIRSHGGDIRVNSIPGQGTTVRFTLPIRQEGRTPIDNDEVVA